MIRLYNSLSRTIEDFKPLNTPFVHIYTCGPTVYDFAHIGNFRTYTTADILIRTLQYNKYDMKYVINLTDVGHLTGDNLGDADIGEDRLEKAAKKEGKTAWDIAKFYTEAFFRDYELLHLRKPEHFARATDHLKEQIALIEKLEKKGYTYQTSDGIYFDTSKFKTYGALSDMDQIKEGARVEINVEKRNPRDFALWKFSYPHGKTLKEYEKDLKDFGEARKESMIQKRHMEWRSPWGIGFPGWHIECSAMSMKYLGDTLDIHVGGIDLKQIHHQNEIAQSEAATGKPFVNYWIHSAFMLVQGERMSKSLGNNYKLYDLMKEGYDPMSLRYLYLQTHYRQEMNFTFAALEAAQNAYKKLLSDITRWEEPKIGCKEYEERFLEAMNEDLNTPQALSIMWEMVKSDFPTGAKAKSLLKMDEILGLGLHADSLILKNQQGIVPEHIKQLVGERNKLRREKHFNAADQLRAEIEKMGYEIEDGKKGTIVKKKTSIV